MTHDPEEQQIWDDHETSLTMARDIAAGRIVYTDDPVPDWTPTTGPENVMVVKTFRLPTYLDEQVKAIAERRGIEVSALLREWVAQCVAADAADVPVSLADVLRAITSVRPLPHAS